MNFDNAIAKLKEVNLTFSDAFEILSVTASLSGNDSTRPLARKLAISALECATKLPESLKPVLTSLLTELGYYPYLSGLERTFKDDLNYEFFRSKDLPHVVFHHDQFLVSEALKKEGGVVLSAPTSFGKSLLIEEIIASKRFNNIVVIEPTLALIDELRTKLLRYSDYYKLIFAKSQRFGSRNIFLLTQERLIEFKGLPKIDFFVIDEFYKLSADSDDRSNVLNHAFYLLSKQTQNYYLLGPPIDSIPANFISRRACKYIESKIETVNIEVSHLGKRKFEVLSGLLRGLSDPTLIYCKGPATAETLVKDLLEDASEAPDLDVHEEAIDWAGANLHKEWSLLKALKKGIAFHHGGLPRHFSKYIVESFNEGKIKCLVCTTTLIEGVNTSAKNVIIYDQKKGKSNLTSFDVRNISGRAGRMGRYLSGHVFSFGNDPVSSQMNVDIPWFTQTNASDELLVQIDVDDLIPSAKTRVQAIANNPELPLEAIRENSNVHALGQIELAKTLRESAAFWHSDLAWNAYPTGSQLKSVCNLIWTYLVPRRPGQTMVDNIVSGDQLAFIIARYRVMKRSQAIISEMVRGGTPPDKAIRECSQHVRHWFEFRFPKLLMALDNIQRTVFTRLGKQPGDYSFFAAQLENGFVPKGIATLREIGVPQELALKLETLITPESQDDVDMVLREIHKLLDSPALHPYERRILRRL